MIREMGDLSVSSGIRIYLIHLTIYCEVVDFFGAIKDFPIAIEVNPKEGRYYLGEDLLG